MVGWREHEHSLVWLIDNESAAFHPKAEERTFDLTSVGEDVRRCRWHLRAIEFRIGAAEALPFPEAIFDAVISSTVLYCPPPDLVPHCIGEMARVLKAGGCLLLATIPVVARLGVAEIKSGPVDLGELDYAVAIKLGRRCCRTCPANPR